MSDLKCPDCGEIIEKGWKLCPYCGSETHKERFEEQKTQIYSNSSIENETTRIYSKNNSNEEKTKIVNSSEKRNTSNRNNLKITVGVIGLVAMVTIGLLIFIPRGSEPLNTQVSSNLQTTQNTPTPKLYTIEEGYLTIGTEAQFPPFEIRKADGSFYGFDIALGEALAKELELKPKFVDTDFASIIVSLNSGKFDIAMSAMTITEDRKKTVNFSDPYFDAGLSMVVPINSTIKNVNDLNGKIVGVQFGTIGDLYVSELKNIKEIKRYAHATDAFLDMKNRKVDAVINDDVVNKPIIASDPKSFKIVGGLFAVEQYGIVIPKDNPDLLVKVNAALKKLKENGTYDQIYNQYIVNWSD